MTAIPDRLTRPPTALHLPPQAIFPNGPASSNAPAPSPMPAYPFEGAGQKLSVEQLARCSRIIDSAKIFVLTPKLAGNKAAFPEIKFTPGQLLPFLSKNLFGKIRGPAYLTGGAASHILTGLEYADVDFSYYMNAEKDLHIPLALIQKFIAWKLGKIPGTNGNEEMPPHNLHEHTLSPEDISHINYYYLQKKVRVPKKFSFIGLGAFELKFILIDNNPRCHVSTSDGFHIPIPPEYPKNLPDHATSSEPNFGEALDALKSRRMIVSAPGEVPLKRLVHKMTQGFEIDSEAEVVNASLAGLVKEYDPTDPDKMTEFKTAVDKHYDNHYRTDNVKGRMLDFLNFCTLIVQIENKEARHAYLKCLVEVWKAMKCPLLNKCISFAEKDLENVNDLLAFMRGIFLLEWTNQNSSVTAYAFDFATLGRTVSPRLHFAFKHDHGPQYLAIPGHPGIIAEEFLASWRNLEKRHADLPETAFTELAQCLDLSKIFLTPSHRPIVVKSLLDRYGRPPISTVMDVNYKSTISPAPFCKAIESEVKAMKAEGCEDLSPEYVLRKTMQYRLEFFRASNLKCGRRNVLAAVEAILNCLKSPQGKPAGNFLASKGDAFAIQDLYFLTEPEKCSLASLLMQGWMAGLSAEQPEELQAILKIACNINRWPGRTAELDKHLIEVMQMGRSLLISAAETLSNTDKIELALNCLSAAFAIPGVAHHKEAQKLCIKICSQASVKGSGVLLRLAAAVAGQAFKTFQSDETNLFWDIAAKLLKLSKNDFEKDKSREDYTKLGLLLLKELAEKCNDPANVRCYLWDVMADILASDNTPSVIKKRFLFFCDVFASLPDHEADHKKLKGVAEQVTADFYRSLEDFIDVVDSLDFSVASSIMLSKQKFTSGMKEKDRQKLLWNKFDQLIKSKKGSDIASAYDFWEAGLKGEQNPRSQNIAAASLTLINALLNYLPNSSDEKVSAVFNILIPALKEIQSHLTTPLSSEAEQMQKGLLQLIQLLAKSARMDSLKMVDDIFDSVGESGLLPSGNKLAVYRDLIISMEIPDSKIVQYYLDLSFGSTNEADIAQALETIHDVIKRCTKTHQEETYRLLWELLATLAKKDIWNDIFDAMAMEFFKAIPTHEKLQMQYNRQFGLGVRNCQNTLFSKLSTNSRKSLLDALLLLGNTALYEEVWASFKYLNLARKEVLMHCRFFQVHCCWSKDRRWLSIFRNSILNSNMLADKELTPHARMNAFDDAARYISDVFHATKEKAELTAEDKNVLSDCLKMIESLWRQASPDICDEVTRSQICARSVEIYIKTATSESLLHACNMISDLEMTSGRLLSFFLDILVQFGTMPPNKISSELVKKLGEMIVETLLSIFPVKEAIISRTEEGLGVTYPFNEVRHGFWTNLWVTIGGFPAKDDPVYAGIFHEALSKLADFEKLKNHLEMQIRRSIRNRLIQSYKGAKHPKEFVRFCQLMCKIGTQEECFDIKRDVLSTFAKLTENYAKEAVPFVSKICRQMNLDPQDISAYKERIAAAKLMISKNFEAYDTMIEFTIRSMVLDLNISPLKQEDRAEVIRELIDILEIAARTLWEPKRTGLDEWPYDLHIKVTFKPDEWAQYTKRMQEKVLQPFAQSISTASTASISFSTLNEKGRNAYWLLPLFQNHDVGLGRKVVSELMASAALPSTPYCELVCRLGDFAGQLKFYDSKNEQEFEEIIRPHAFKDSCNWFIVLSQRGGNINNIDFKPIETLSRLFKYFSKKNFIHEIKPLMDAAMLAYNLLLASTMWRRDLTALQKNLEDFFKLLAAFDLSQCTAEEKTLYRHLLVKLFKTVSTGPIFCTMAAGFSIPQFAACKNKKLIKDLDISVYKTKAKQDCKDAFPKNEWTHLEDFLFEEIWTFVQHKDHEINEMEHVVLRAIDSTLKVDKFKQEIMASETHKTRGFSLAAVMLEAHKEIVIKTDKLDKPLAKSMNELYDDHSKLLGVYVKLFPI